MKNKIIFLSAFSFLLLPFLSKGQDVARSIAKIALDNEIKTLQKDACLKNASWSVCVQNIKSGEIVAEYNSNISLIPASVMKLVTTSAALALLGSDFKFETRLQYTGTIDSVKGVLHGNLYLTGGGDPALGSQRFGEEVSVDSVFNEFIHVLLKKGIRMIDGNLIADESIFDYQVPASWEWEDMGNYFGSGTCGLSINENSYRLFFDAGAAIGDSAKLVNIEPPMPGIRFINMVKTGTASSGDNVNILGGPYTDLRILEGTVPLGKKNFDVDGAIPDPALYCVQLFHDALEKNGIKTGKDITTIREEIWKGTKGIKDTNARKDLSVHYSPALSDIIYYTNLKSVNMFAETILKMIGYRKSGTGSTEAGTDAVKKYLQTKNIDLTGFHMYDGCGLSRKDEITTMQLCGVLSSFYHHPEYKSLTASLPVAGKSGGMKSLLKNTVAENNLMAKTGNMADVRSYAGYVKNKSKEDLAFVIIMNNFTCPTAEVKKKCEKLMKLIAELD